MSREAWNFSTTVFGYATVIAVVSVVGMFGLRSCEATEESWRAVGSACVQSGGSWVKGGPTDYQCIGAPPQTGGK